jgi:hypothetical protein
VYPGYQWFIWGLIGFALRMRGKGGKSDAPYEIAVDRTKPDNVMA